MVLSLPGFLHLTYADIFDILIVAAIIYLVFRGIRGSSAMNIFIAILILLVARIVSVAIGMRLVSSLLGTILDVGVIAIIVIFQPEIRRFLNRLGRSAGDSIEKRNILARLLGIRHDPDLKENSIAEISEACFEMASVRTGALIVLAKEDRLEDILASGDRIDAVISKRLLMNIFFKNAPLHDGAVIIRDNRITAARCTLPISDDRDIPASYGMRHKAALGLSEQCDASILIVSEQTGKVSLARRGSVTRVSNINQLKLLLAEKQEAQADERRKD